MIVDVHRTTLDEVQRVEAVLDADTLETERIVGSAPRDSLIDSRTAWAVVDGRMEPMFSYGVIPTNRGARAWMMTTSRVRECGLARALLDTMRTELRAEVGRYGRLEGVVRTSSRMPRVLALFGATFTLPNHPQFLLWSVEDNARLWRDA